MQQFEIVERCGRVYVVKNGVESAGFAQRIDGKWRIFYPKQWDCLEYSLEDALDTFSIIMGDWYTIPQAAERLVELGVFDSPPSAQMVGNWARAGKFPGAVKVRGKGCKGGGGTWRIPEAALAAFVAERREQ